MIRISSLASFLSRKTSIFLAVVICLFTPSAAMAEGDSELLLYLLIERPQITFAGSEKISPEWRRGTVVKRLEKAIRVRPLPTVEAQWLGNSAAVMAGDQLILTIIPEDVPDLPVKADPSMKKAMEMEVAGQWASVIQREFKVRQRMQTGKYKTFFFRTVLMLLAFALVSNVLLNKVAIRIGRPLWSMKLLVWSFALGTSLLLHPSGGEVAATFLAGWLAPIGLLATLFGFGFILLSIFRTCVLLYCRQLLDHYKGDDLERLRTRLVTLREGLDFVVKLALIVLGFVAYLVSLGYELGSLLTGAGAMGVAVTLAGQELLKDIIAGASMLLDDQVGVGDTIVADGKFGVVESFTLRTTSLRLLDGGIAVIPNSRIKLLINHSKGWSQVDFSVPIAHDADSKKSLQILNETVQTMFEERDDLDQEASILGVDSLTENSYTLRVLWKTPPLAHFGVRRELNRRIKERFQEEGIRLAPQHRLNVNSDSMAAIAQDLTAPTE